MMFSKTIKKLSLIIGAVFVFSFVAGFFPKDTRAMLLREKSLRESFFTQLIDEINLASKQVLSQSIRLNYEKPLGIEILFRNPSEQKASGLLKLKESKLKTLMEKDFSLEPKSPAGFYFFAFPELKDTKGEEFWLEITNAGDIPLIVGYYNQDVYHYGDLYLNKDLQPGVLQFQIHYEIDPFQELSSRIGDKINQIPLFFAIWLAIIVFMTIAVILLAKNYRTEVKKKS